MTSKQDQNKQSAMAFYELLFTQGQPSQAADQYLGSEYIQHNPTVGDGKQPFIDYFERMAVEYPDKKVVFKRAVAEGDLVVLHCQQIWPDDVEYAGIDIFRFDQDGKIVEHWDVLQEVPKTAKHDNTMF